MDVGTIAERVRRRVKGLRDPVAGLRAGFALWVHAWPWLRPLAQVYRATALSDCRLVAVTGTFGKSTTVRAIHAALDLPLDPLFSLNAGGYVPKNLLRVPARQAIACVEVGIDRAGDMVHYAALIRPDTTVMTSIGSEHQRSLGTLDATLREKAELALPARRVFLNGDDEHLTTLLPRLGDRARTFGFGERCDVRALDVRSLGVEGQAFVLSSSSFEAEVTTRLIGAHFVRAYLAAFAVAVEHGVAPEEATRRLSTLEPTPGRLSAHRTPDGVWLLRDDFKSTLETVHTAIDTLAAVEGGRRLVVMGEVSEPPGKQGPLYRDLGARLANVADHVIFVGGRVLRKCVTGAREAGMADDRMTHAGRDWRAAARELHRRVEPGDVVLIKGRGNQRLERIALSLMGRDVACRRVFCDLNGFYVDGERCGVCPGLNDDFDV